MHCRIDLTQDTAYTHLFPDVLAKASLDTKASKRKGKGRKKNKKGKKEKKIKRRKTKENKIK